MTGQAEPVDLARGITGILGALVLFSAVSQLLEYTLVSAAGGDAVKDMASYLAALNRPSILAVKAIANVMVALLAGYLAAKIARARELMFAGIAAAAETCSLVYGFTMGEYVVLPFWIRALLVLTTGPAMMAGAWIRMQARLATAATATGESA
ncbi:MAG TPA: hypothetical protein VFD69_06525 [Vicinamibacterales bacterium]|nr:hypothetical protein [Vicinamibacterales bacterium]